MEKIIQYFFFLAIITASLVLLILLQEYIDRKRKLNFAEKYLNKLTQFSNLISDNHFDNKLYNWLTQNEPEIQMELGVLGESGSGKDTYKIVSNTIPNLAMVGQGRAAFHQIDTSEKEVFNCKHALNRHIGLTKQYLKKAKQDLINPIKWIHTAILLPFYVFRWLGFKNSSVEKLETNQLFKMISSFVLFTEFVAFTIKMFHFFKYIYFFIN